MKQRLMSLGFWAGMALLTVLVWAASAVSVLLGGWWDRSRLLGHGCARAWAWALIRMNPFWHLTVDRRARLERNRPYVFVANHQSLVDIIVLYHVGHQFKWVAKSSLFRVPFLGWTLSINRHIRLQRESLRSIRRTMEEAKQWLDRRMSVAFFAEGSRSQTGALTPFKLGAFKLAIQTRTPIVPLVITGTRDALPRGSWVFSRRMHGTLTVLPPIDTTTYQLKDAELLKNRVFQEIERVFLAHTPHRHPTLDLPALVSAAP